MIPLLITHDMPEWTPCKTVIQHVESVTWARPEQTAGLVIVLGHGHENSQTLQWIAWADRAGAPRGIVQDLQGIEIGSQMRREGG